MKTKVLSVNFVLTIISAALLFTSCNAESITNETDIAAIESTAPLDLEVYDEGTYDAIASLHSSAINFADKILLEESLNPSDLSVTQMAAVTETAVLASVEKYIADLEGRSLTKAERKTIQNETHNFWSDTRHIQMFDNLSNYSSVIPETGIPDLNKLYQDFNISISAQKYYNKIFSGLNSNDYKAKLNNISLEVRASSLSSKDKTALLEVIAVMKDSYEYWNKPGFGGPTTRQMNPYIRMCLISDAGGAIRGVWRGLGSATTGLIFGPGGTILTITGSIVVNAAVSSIRKGVILALIG